MKRAYLIILTLNFIAFCSCCPLNSVNPLSDPKDAIQENRLAGTWHGNSKENTDVYLHVGQIAGDNHTQAILIEHKKNGDLDFVNLELIIFPTTIKDESYLNIKVSKLFENSLSGDLGYIFVKYTFSSKDTLTFSFIDPEIVENAFQTGALKGTISKEKAFVDRMRNTSKLTTLSGCTKITDTTQNIVKFISSTDTEKLFSKSMRFKKIE